MTYNTWTDEDTELRPDGTPWPSYTPAISIQVDANGGTVVVQARDSTGTWAPFADYTFSEDTLQIIEVAALPALRIVTTGSAKFRLTRG